MKKNWTKRLTGLALTLVLTITQTGLLGANAMTVKAEGVGATAEEVSLQDPDFAGDFWGGGIWSVATDSWDDTTVEPKDDNTINFWKKNKGSISITQVIASLPAGTYTMTVTVMGDAAQAAPLLGGQTGEAAALSGWGTWDAVTAVFEVEEERTDAAAGVALDLNDGGWGYVKSITISGVSYEEDAVEPENNEGYKVTVALADAGITVNDTVSLTAVVTYNGKAVTDLAEAGLYLWWWTDSWNVHADGNSDAVYSNYDGNSGHSLNADVTLPTAGTYYIAAELQDSSYTDVTETQFVTISVAEASAPEPPVIEEANPVEANVSVEKIAGLPADFITGADVSSYISVVESGAVFYDENGNALDAQGFFDLLAAGGTNYIRIRVWHNPYDAGNNGYGGGNNDLETAKRIGQYATNAGMKVLIDFHYSDFWADPGKQKAPKAWEGMGLSEKEAAVYEYTKNSLEYLLAEGVDVGMVQVGNETTSKFCGESNWTNICKLFHAGAKAIREVSDDIMVAIHFTNPERSGNYANLAKTLSSNSVDYDVFATSYYPYWHGTIANLTSVLKHVADTYGKKVMVAETSWAFSLADGDGHDNTVRVGSNDKNQPYDFTVQGQCNEIASVAKAVADVGEAGIGLFYWEAAWIPVAYAYDEAGNLINSVYQSNKALWEQNGSGWASSYAAEYDPSDAGKWFGGSAVDNQAWFDFEGKALDTVNIYKYIRTGTTVAAAVTGVSVDDVTVGQAGAATVAMPQTVTVTYNTGATATAAVVWNLEEVRTAASAGAGSYTIHGTYVLGEKEAEITTTLTILPDNLLVNAGFESGSAAPWTIAAGSTGSVTKDDPHSGAKSYHYYNAKAFGYSVSQVVAVEAGVYDFGGCLQGSAKADGESYQIFVTVGEETYTADAAPEGWAVWQSPVISGIEIAEATEITVGFTATANAGAWGTWDDFYLYRTADYTAPEATEDNGSVGTPEEPDGDDADETQENALETPQNPSEGTGAEAESAADAADDGGESEPALEEDVTVEQESEAAADEAEAEVLADEAAEQEDEAESAADAAGDGGESEPALEEDVTVEQESGAAADEAEAEVLADEAAEQEDEAESAADAADDGGESEPALEEDVTVEQESEAAAGEAEAEVLADEAAGQEDEAESAADVLEIAEEATPLAAGTAPIQTLPIVAGIGAAAAFAGAGALVFRRKRIR